MRTKRLLIMPIIAFEALDSGSDSFGWNSSTNYAESYGGGSSGGSGGGSTDPVDDGTWVGNGMTPGAGAGGETPYVREIDYNGNIDPLTGDETEAPIGNDTTIHLTRLLDIVQTAITTIDLKRKIDAFPHTLLGGDSFGSTAPYSTVVDVSTDTSVAEITQSGKHFLIKYHGSKKDTSFVSKIILRHNAPILPQQAIIVDASTTERILSVSCDSSTLFVNNGSIITVNPHKILDTSVYVKTWGELKNTVCDVSSGERVTVGGFANTILSGVKITHITDSSAFDFITDSTTGAQNDTSIYRFMVMPNQAITFDSSVIASINGKPQNTHDNIVAPNIVTGILKSYKLRSNMYPGNIYRYEDFVFDTSTGVARLI